jgi:Amt family ammonium transporter
MNLIPGLRLRASEEAEVLGMDDAEIGEFAYDYVELTRDVINGDALMDDTESKFSGEGESPIGPHEKGFSSTTDETALNSRMQRG